LLRLPGRLSPLVRLLSLLCYAQIDEFLKRALP
jgi:hypothetical protein